MNSVFQLRTVRDCAEAPANTCPQGRQNAKAWQELNSSGRSLLRHRGSGLATLAGAAALIVVLGSRLHAQAPASPNQGAIQFNGGLDVPTIYFFRGIRQEGEARLTLWPYGDIGITLGSGDGVIKSARIRIGVWNSLHTGTSGTGGPFRQLHYQEDFYTAFALGLAGGIGVETTYVARTSPNGSFRTVKELDLRFSKNGWIAPYGTVAFELSGEGQADGGLRRGTYLELGAGPNVRLPIGSARLAIPVKIGISLKDYYELVGRAGTTTDNAFGFFDIGGLVTIPISWVAPRFGAWNIHGGAELIRLGDTTTAFNTGQKTKVVGLLGIGVTY